jgi:integrase
LEIIGEGPLSTETISSFASSWLSGKEVSTKRDVYKLYKKVITKFLAHLGDKALKSLSDITPRDVAAYRDQRLKCEGVSTSTFLLDLKVLRSLFGLARRQGLILHSPAEAVEIPPVRHIERGVFDLDEIRALLSVAPSAEWRVAIALGFFAGARLSDAVSMRWDSIDPSTGSIRYTQGKTGTRVLIPIHPDLEAQLLEVASSDNPQGYLCPHLVKMPVQGRGGLSSQFVRIMETAGIDRKVVQAAKNRFSSKSFHSLRHSFTSHLATAGVSADVRMRLTGHKTFDVHQQYTHLELAALRDGITALPSLST